VSDRSTDDEARFLSEDCTECGTPGFQRHLSAVGGCATCMAGAPWPVYIPVRNVLMGTLKATKAAARPPRYSPFTGVASASPQPLGEC